MEKLLARIMARITENRTATDDAYSKKPKKLPPATEVEVSAAEATLGFPLPPLLRRLYLEVGNGGFGPGYGLIGVQNAATNKYRQDFIDDYYRKTKLPRSDSEWWPAALIPQSDFDIVTTFQGFMANRPADPAWHWSPMLLPVAHLGCGMYECVDCSSPAGAVSWFEPNPRESGDPVSDFIIFLSPSLEQRMEAWLSEVDLMSPAYETSLLKKRMDDLDR